MSDAVKDGKTFAIIAHIGTLGLIIALILNMEKKNSFAAFHVRQNLGLQLTGLALGIIAVIPILGWIVAIVGIILLFVMWVSGLINSINGKEKPMPVLGKQYAEWFKSVQA